MTLKLLFVGDGARDEAAVPQLVAGILDTEVGGDFEPWARLHRRGAGRGLGRKLLFSIRQALDRGSVGVVATVDADQFDASGKLPELKAAREQDRAKGHQLPAALGEAIPHLEAWLIDDPVAVRTAFGIPSSTEIMSPTKLKSPKDELNRLHGECGVARPVVEVLAAIACGVKSERCIHGEHTGFRQFAAEVASEIGPLAKS